MRLLFEVMPMFRNGDEFHNLTSKLLGIFLLQGLFYGVHLGIEPKSLCILGITPY